MSNKNPSSFWLILITAIFLFYSCEMKMNNKSAAQESSNEAEEEAKEGYDGPKDRDILEFEKTKDPTLGRIPDGALAEALDYTEALKQTDAAKMQDYLPWVERGPIYDSIGPSNGNYRGGFGNPAGTYTSGRIRAVLVDPTDATGNTVWVGGVAGGVWKTSNLLDAEPAWQNINDKFDNMAISSICIDPANTNIMYFSTGEPTVNQDAVQGLGIWKSTDHGITWNRLPSTASFTLTFKILCDNAGNLYVAQRSTGIRRSTDGGSSWTTISPTSTSCTDIELSSTGAMHIAMGYYTSAGTAKYYFCSNPATVTTTGWTQGTGLIASANRLELAVVADTVWAVSTSTANNVNYAFKSIDGGATFTQQNSTAYTTSLSNTQGWYNISLAISPDSASAFIVGGLDAYRSLTNGASVSRMSYWVSTAPYVHADHHFVQWWKVDGETRVLMACDGGLFLSRNNGVTFADKNKDLAIKQFYSCAIHPTLPNYFLAGAQDNGSHKLNNPGLTYSIEVTGGDGAYVDIDQDQPSIQFTSYVYNQYRRSTNGGVNFTSFNHSSTIGLFINPFDYDDLSKKLYASYGSTLFRWNDAATAVSVATSSTTILTVPSSVGNITALTNSPNVPKRLYVGTSSSRLIRIDNADTVSNLSIGDFSTDLTGPGFAGTINCIAEGSTDQQLLAIFSNYGVTNVWHSTNGGSNWTGIDGNLPNMPVRWAVFDPTDDKKIILATEGGVYVTTSVNGAATQWLPSANFPTVRTDMLKVRKSDNLILAATHGRGLWSSHVYEVVPVRNINLQARLDASGNAVLQWDAAGATHQTKFTIQMSINGISFTNLETVAGTVRNYRHLLTHAVGYYRIVGVENNNKAAYSNIAFVKFSKEQPLQLRIAPNPVINDATFAFTSAAKGTYTWVVSDASGKIVQRGTGSLPAGGMVSLPLKTAALARGTYYLQVMQEGQKVSGTFVKQ